MFSIAESRRNTEKSSFNINPDEQRNSRSWPSLRMEASPQFLGTEFFHSPPNPNFSNRFFLFSSRSQILGIWWRYVIVGKFKESKKNNCSRKGSSSLNWKSVTEMRTSSFEIRLQNWMFFCLSQISSEPLQSPRKMNIESLLCVHWRSFRCFPTFYFHLLKPGVNHFFVFGSESFLRETLPARGTTKLNSFSL